VRDKFGNAEIWTSAASALLERFKLNAQHNIGLTDCPALDQDCILMLIKTRESVVVAVNKRNHLRVLGNGSVHRTFSVAKSP
jgi:hypothetical protein